MLEVFYNLDGSTHKLVIDETPFDSFKDLMIEDRKGVFLSFLRLNNPSPAVIELAKTMALCCEVIKDGLPPFVPHQDQQMSKALTVGNLPTEVLRRVKEEYHGQFQKIDHESIYNFKLKATPFTGLDDLAIESGVQKYLSIANIEFPDDAVYAKARTLAKVEYIVMSGLSIPQGHDPQTGRALAVGHLHPSTINWIINKHRALTGGGAEADPKVS